MWINRSTVASSPAKQTWMMWIDRSTVASSPPKQTWIMWIDRSTVASSPPKQAWMTWIDRSTVASSPAKQAWMTWIDRSTVASSPAKQAWMIWINVWNYSTKSYNITIRKRSPTKTLGIFPGIYFMNAFFAADSKANRVVIPHREVSRIFFKTGFIFPTWYIYALYSLGPSDAIWRWRSWSKLVQVMGYCLTAPSHYLNQCWLIISKVLWHSSEDIIIRRFEDTN